MPTFRRLLGVVADAGGRPPDPWKSSDRPRGHGRHSFWCWDTMCRRFAPWCKGPTAYVDGVGRTSARNSTQPAVAARAVPLHPYIDGPYPQTAACNRFHVVEAPARWLLMTHDRVKSDQFRMTHEFRAHAGVRRVGVTKAAQALRSAT